MAKSFTPIVILDSHVVTPPDQMWILGLAPEACQWIIEHSMPDDFLWLQERNNHHTREIIAALEKEIERLKKELGHSLPEGIDHGPKINKKRWDE